MQLLVFVTRGDSGGLRRKKADEFRSLMNLRGRFEPGSCGCRRHALTTEETGSKKERDMRSVLRKSPLLLAIAAAAPLIAGCATKAEVEMAQATANQALATAQSATSAAQAAQQRADQAQQTAQLAQSTAQSATSAAAAAQASSAAAQASAAAAQQAANQASSDVRAAQERAATFAAARGPRG
jgi:hypothetical protein